MIFGDAAGAEAESPGDSGDRQSVTYPLENRRLCGRGELSPGDASRVGLQSAVIVVVHQRAISPGEMGFLAVTHDSSPRRSGHLEARIAQIPKLTVRVWPRPGTEAN